jgi:hypothetical protein
VFDIAGLAIDDHVEELGRTVGQALLEPTRIYARAVRKVLSYYTVKSVVHGIAHITGGGLAENLERILPAGAQAVLRRGSWPVPPVFAWLQRLGQVDSSLSSAPTTPPASSTNWPTADWRVFRSARSPPVCAAWRGSESTRRRLITASSSPLTPRFRTHVTVRPDVKHQALDPVLSDRPSKWGVGARPPERSHKTE